MWIMDGVDEYLRRHWMEISEDTHGFEWRLSIVIHHSLYPILELFNVKIDEIAQLNVHQSHVCKQLFVMNGLHFHYRFNLNDHLTVDQQVKSQFLTQFYSLVFYFDRHLRFHLKSVQSQFVRHSLFVDIFQ